ncbi:unnamed protein product [Cylindrotheca closterium]|uniref:RING-type domain-containing protein n=1 Tax=Cylindrotheca closterium TaxID=2856 RepID=A0AAD2JIC6_9STRA|nr:unnamed protein product [Cylindrotheca closterium]
MPISTRIPHNCRSILTGLSLILCTRILIISALSLYELDQTYGNWEKTEAVIVAAVNVNDRNDINNRNTTESSSGMSNNTGTSDVSDFSPDAAAVYWCSQLNYTVSNDYITIVSSIASDCDTDPAEIPVGRDIELRYNPTNPRDFIKQSEYYDDITNLIIRIVLALILIMSLISFIIKYRNLPEDPGRDPRFARDLETGEPQESPEARKERILSKMIFQPVKEDLSNTTAAAIRSLEKKTKSDNQEAEFDPIEEDGCDEYSRQDDNSSAVEGSESSSMHGITIENVDGTSCSPEDSTEEDVKSNVGEENNGAVDNLTAEVENATSTERFDGPVDPEAQMAAPNGEETITGCKDDMCRSTRSESIAENRTSAAGSIRALQSMFSSWRRMESDSEQAECCICLDNYDPGSIICASKNVECNHVFHKDCIMDWMMKNHNQCPLCRVDLLK